MSEDAEKVRRLRELASWMRSLGACHFCALGMGLAAVEKEWAAEEPYDWRSVRGKCLSPPATTKGRTGPTCEARVRERWTERPRREPLKAAA